MKTLINLNFVLLILCTVVISVGCSKSDIQTKDLPSNPNIEEPTKEIKLSVDELSFEPEASSQTIDITSDVDWKIGEIKDMDWCKITPSSGTSGGKISITVEENTTSENRSGSIIFYFDGVIERELKITQYSVLGSEETNYVEIDWEELRADAHYFYGTGEINLSLPDMNQAAVYTKGKAIVLSESYGSGIRVIESVETNGNQVTMQTSPGDMTDLFNNIEFTLVTNPNVAQEPTKSGSKRVITPSEIGTFDEFGNYVKLYDKSNMAVTRGRGENMINQIYDFGTTYLLQQSESSGPDSYIACPKQGFDIRLDGSFDFKFGDGKLDYLNLKLGGDFNMNPSFRAEIHSEKTLDYETANIYKGQPIPTVMTFFVGFVPVVIVMPVGMHGYASVTAKAGVDITVGLDFKSKADIEINYKGGSGISPSVDFDATIDPTINIIPKGSLEAKISAYPRFNFLLYGLGGPFIQVMPYFGISHKASLQAYGINNNWNYWWQSGAQAGLMYKVGVTTAFHNTKKKKPNDNDNDNNEDIQLEYSTNVNEFSPATIDLFKKPTTIELVSPSADTKVSGGNPIDVTFRVRGENLVTGTKDPVAGAVVEFKLKQGGVLSTAYATSDGGGLATVEWVPLSSNDELDARIRDGDGVVAGRVNFKPTIEPNRDREALETIFRNIGKDGDFYGEPIKEWPGVTVDPQSGRVIKLDLRYFNTNASCDFTAISELQEVELVEIYITSLNFKGLSKLKSIKMYGHGDIGSIDVSNAISLEHLSLANHSISSSLNISGCTKLAAISVPNGVEELYASGCSNLSTITDIRQSKLNTLDLSGCAKLQSIFAREINSLEYLYVGGCTSLSSIDITENKLTTLDVKGLNSLKTLECSNNSLGSLDVSGLKNLEVLNCSHNKLTILSVSGCSKLADIKADNNELTTINLSGLSLANRLNLRNNKLTGELDLSEYSIPNPYIGVNGFYLEGENNKLTVIYVKNSDMTALGLPKNGLDYSGWGIQDDSIYFDYDGHYDGWQYPKIAGK